MCFALADRPDAQTPASGAVDWTWLSKPTCGVSYGALVIDSPTPLAQRKSLLWERDTSCRSPALHWKVNRSYRCRLCGLSLCIYKYKSHKTLHCQYVLVTDEVSRKSYQETVQEIRFALLFDKLKNIMWTYRLSKLSNTYTVVLYRTTSRTSTSWTGINLSQCLNAETSNILYDII